MSARCPAAVWKPLAATQPAKIKPEVVCVHTIVGSMASTWAGWKGDGYGGLESTFMVGGKWGADGARDLDGVAWQVAEADRWCDANYQGSHRIISIETGDNAPRFAGDIEPWTPKQAAKLVEVIAWACVTYDIPPVLVADSKPGRRGLAYHRQGCEHSDGLGSHLGFLVRGGERWSTSVGKECPGPARIRQFVNEIIPAVKARIEEDDMPSAKEIAEALRPVIRQELAAFATEDEVFPNLKQSWEDPAKPNKLFTLAGILSNIEKDTDHAPAGPPATTNN